MRSPLRDGFAADLATLDEAALTALVADLWRALGWEVTVADRTVTVERAGERRVVAVRPARSGIGRLRRPDSLEDADVVVDAGGARRVRSAARESGVEYVGPRELRDRLRYAVPRDTGRALAEQYLGRSLEAGAAGADQRSLREMGSALAVLGLVVVVVLAGPLGLLPAGQGGTAGPATASPAGTPTGTTTPTATPDPHPAGLSAAGVENASALAAAHVREVKNRQYAVTVTFDGPSEAEGFGNWTSVRWQVRVESRHHFSLAANYSGGTMPATSVGVYSNGVLLYRRVAVDNETRYEAIPAEARDSRGYLYVVSDDIEEYLSTPESSVERVVTAAGPRYRVVATGTPETLSGNVENYRAEALVTPEGRVTELAVTYTLVVDGERRQVRIRYEYSEYREALVDRPWWYEDARNATAEGDLGEDGSQRLDDTAARAAATHDPLAG